MERTDLGINEPAAVDGVARHADGFNGLGLGSEAEREAPYSGAGMATEGGNTTKPEADIA
jgi:hypothetical protein